jgi:FkbM family methyltransferase
MKNKLFTKFLNGISYIKFRLKYQNVLFIRSNILFGKYYSQDGQDMILSTLLLNEISDENNLIIDIGANHPVKYSNSLFFEKYFNCKTIAIDPISEFKPLWDKLRPQAKFISIGLGSSTGFLDINIPKKGDNMFSSVEGGLMKKYRHEECEQRKIKVDTLKNILIKEGIKKILFISIDVEGFEFQVLEGIDFDKVEISALVVENNSTSYFGEDKIRDFIIDKGFIYYARLGSFDDVFVNPNLVCGA